MWMLKCSRILPKLDKIKCISFASTIIYFCFANALVYFGNHWACSICWVFNGLTDVNEMSHSSITCGHHWPFSSVQEKTFKPTVHMEKCSASLLLATLFGTPCHASRKVKNVTGKCRYVVFYKCFAEQNLCEQTSLVVFLFSSWYGYLPFSAKCFSGRTNAFVTAVST